MLDAPVIKLSRGRLRWPVTAGWSLMAMVGATTIYGETQPVSVPALAFAAGWTALALALAARATRMAGIIVYRDRIVVHGWWRKREIPVTEVKGFATDRVVGGYGLPGDVLVLELRTSRVRMGEWWSSHRNIGPNAIPQVASRLNGALDAVHAP